MKYTDPPALKPKGKLPENFDECLTLAEGIFQKAGKMRLELADQSLLFDGEAGKLRWFMVPSEAQVLLSNRRSQAGVRKLMPFEPPAFNSMSLLQANDMAKSVGDKDDARIDLDIGDRNDAKEYSTEGLDWHDTNYFQSSMEHGFIGGRPDAVSENAPDKSSKSEEQVAADNLPTDVISSDIERKCAIGIYGSVGRINECTSDLSCTDVPSQVPHLASATDVKNYQNNVNELSIQSTESTNTKLESLQNSLPKTCENIVCSTIEVQDSSNSNSNETAIVGNTGNAKVKEANFKALDHVTETAMDTSSKTWRFGVNENVSPVCELKPGKNECVPCMLPRRNDSNQAGTTTQMATGSEGNRAAVKFHAPPKKIFKPTLQVSWL